MSFYVFELPGARQIHGKVIVIWWTIMTFVAIGFEHSIANMFFIPLGMMLGLFLPVLVLPRRLCVVLSMQQELDVDRRRIPILHAGATQFRRFPNLRRVGRLFAMLELQ